MFEMTDKIYLPLNAMVEAAPWVHALCVWASYLPSTATCVINQSKSMADFHNNY